MPDKAYLDVRDYGNEMSRSSFNVIPVTAGNFTAQAGLLTALVAAYDPISLGTMAGSGMQIITAGSLVAPSDDEAQIETVWKIIYSDTQAFLDPGTDLIPNPGFGKRFQLDWPTALFDGMLLPNTDEADLIGDEMAAFVTAFQAIARSPYGGTVTILSINVSGADR